MLKYIRCTEGHGYPIVGTILIITLDCGGRIYTHPTPQPLPSAYKAPSDAGGLRVGLALLPRARGGTLSSGVIGAWKHVEKGMLRIHLPNAFGSGHLGLGSSHDLGHSSNQWHMPDPRCHKPGAWHWWRDKCPERRHAIVYRAPRLSLLELP